MQLTFVVHTIFLLDVPEGGGMGKKTVTKAMAGKFLRLMKIITLKIKVLLRKVGY